VSADETQALLDTLAAELGFALSLEDADQRLLAYTDTEHAMAMDEVRVATILGRRVAPAVRVWFEQWGIRDAAEPVRTPASDEINAIARWCVPVRYRGALLGYVWVLDGGELPAERLGGAIDVAAAIAAVLYRRRLAERADEELLRLLLLPREDADDALTETYRHRGPIAVLVVGSAEADELERPALAEARNALRRGCDSFASGTAISGEVGGLAAAIVPLRRSEDTAPARRTAEAALRLFARHGDGIGAAGISGVAASVAAAAAAHGEARRALRVARAVPAFGPIAVWDELGVFRTLAMVPAGHLDDDVIDPRVRTLLGHPTLAATAEAFLDSAGDAQVTAGRLLVHRATLYQRLGRIRDVTGLDLMRSGDDRLVTHLGLRLRQLSA
jgi:DNA-binding PucR family transcriptional regulator